MDMTASSSSNDAVLHGVFPSMKRRPSNAVASSGSVAPIVADVVAPSVHINHRDDASIRRSNSSMRGSSSELPNIMRSGSRSASPSLANSLGRGGRDRSGSVSLRASRASQDGSHLLQAPGRTSPYQQLTRDSSLRGRSSRNARKNSRAAPQARNRRSLSKQHSTISVGASASGDGQHVINSTNFRVPATDMADEARDSTSAALYNLIDDVQDLVLKAHTNIDILALFEGGAREDLRAASALDDRASSRVSFHGDPPNANEQETKLKPGFDEYAHERLLAKHNMSNPSTPASSIGHFEEDDESPDHLRRLVKSITPEMAALRETISDLKIARRSTAHERESVFKLMVSRDRDALIKNHIKKVTSILIDVTKRMSIMTSHDNLGIDGGAATELTPMKATNRMRSVSPAKSSLPSLVKQQHRTPTVTPKKALPSPSAYIGGSHQKGQERPRDDIIVLDDDLAASTAGHTLGGKADSQLSDAPNYRRNVKKLFLDMSMIIHDLADLRDVLEIDSKFLATQRVLWHQHGKGKYNRDNVRRKLGNALLDYDQFLKRMVEASGGETDEENIVGLQLTLKQTERELRNAKESISQLQAELETVNQTKQKYAREKVKLQNEVLSLQKEVADLKREAEQARQRSSHHRGVKDDGLSAIAIKKLQLEKKVLENEVSSLRQIVEDVDGMKRNLLDKLSTDDTIDTNYREDLMKLLGPRNTSVSEGGGRGFMKEYFFSKLFDMVVNIKAHNLSTMGGSGAGDEIHPGDGSEAGDHGAPAGTPTSTGSPTPAKRGWNKVKQLVLQRRVTGLTLIQSVDQAISDARKDDLLTIKTHKIREQRLSHVVAVLSKYLQLSLSTMRMLLSHSNGSPSHDSRNALALDLKRCVGSGGDERSDLLTKIDEASTLQHSISHFESLLGDLTFIPPGGLVKHHHPEGGDSPVLDDINVAQRALIGLLGHGIVQSDRQTDWRLRLRTLSTCVDSMKGLRWIQQVKCNKKLQVGLPMVAQNDGTGTSTKNAASTTSAIAGIATTGTTSAARGSVGPGTGTGNSDVGTGTGTTGNSMATAGHAPLQEVVPAASAEEKETRKDQEKRGEQRRGTSSRSQSRRSVSTAETVAKSVARMEQLDESTRAALNCRPGSSGHVQTINVLVEDQSEEHDPATTLHQLSALDNVKDWKQGVEETHPLGQAPAAHKQSSSKKQDASRIAARSGSMGDWSSELESGDLETFQAVK